MSLMQPPAWRARSHRPQHHRPGGGTSAAGAWHPGFACGAHGDAAPRGRDRQSVERRRGNERERTGIARRAGHPRESLGSRPAMAYLCSAGCAPIRCRVPQLYGQNSPYTNTALSAAMTENTKASAACTPASNRVCDVPRTAIAQSRRLPSMIALSRGHDDAALRGRRRQLFEPHHEAGTDPGSCHAPGCRIHTMRACFRVRRVMGPLGPATAAASGGARGR